MVRVFDVSKATLLMALTGHKKAVTALTFNNDGTILISGSKDTDIIVWDLVSETGVVRFRGHKDEVTDLLLLPTTPASGHGQGQHILLSSSKDTLVKVWNLRTRMCVQTVVGIRSEVWCLGMSSSSEEGGTRIYAGSSDNLLRVWAVHAREGEGGQAGDVLHPLGALVRTTHDRASGICVSRDGLYICVSSAGKSVEVYQRRQGGEVRARVLRRLRRVREKQNKKAGKEELQEATGKRKRSGSEQGAGADGDGDEEEDDFGMIGTSLADLDKAIAQLEQQEGKKEGSGVDGEASSAPSLVPIIASDENGLVGLVQAGAKIASCALVEGGSAGMAGGAARPLTTVQMLLGLVDNRCELYTLPVGEEAVRALGGEGRTFTAASGATLPLAVLTRSMAQGGHRSDVRAVAISEDGGMALTTSVGEAKLWNIASGACLRTLSLLPEASEGEGGGEGTAAAKAGATGLCCAFGPGARHAFVGTKSGHLLSFDLGTGDRLEGHAAHEGPLWSLALRPDGKALCTGGADKEVKFWEFDLVEKAVSAPAPMKGGKAPVPVAPAPTVRVLALVHARTLKVGDEVLAVCYSKHVDQAKLLLAVSLLDSTVKVFHDDSLKFFLSLYGHKLPVLCMDVSGDGTLLATGSADKSVKVWGLDFGDCHKSFPAHTDAVTTIAWLGNTHYFLSGGKDRAIRYWDGDRFERILALEGYHKGEVWGVAAAKDGKTFISVGADRSLRVWKRTNEQIFLDEEKERALEDALDRDVRDGDGEEVLTRADMVGPRGADGLAKKSDKEEDSSAVATAPVVADSGLLSEATIIVAHATKATGKGAERLAEALALASEEHAKWLEYAEDLAEASKEAGSSGSSSGVDPPPPNPELLGLTPTGYILRTLRAVRPADVDQVLLTLPFADALRLLQFCSHLLASSQGVELIGRTVLLLLRVHGPQLSSSPSLMPFMSTLQAHMQAATGAAADTVGFNAAALGVLQASLLSLQQSEDGFGPTEGSPDGPGGGRTTAEHVDIMKDRKAGKGKGDKKAGQDGIKVGKRRKVHLL